jgi:hypothetical protein
MKKILHLILLCLLCGFCLDGCKDEEDPEGYYKGKIISLNNNSGCPNMMEIVQAVENGLVVGTSIGFDSELYDGKLEYGQVVLFKIINYQEYMEILPAICISPQYNATIVFY